MRSLASAVRLLVLLSGLLLGTGPAWALMLVSPDEASLPPPRAVMGATRGITRGPGVEMVQPSGTLAEVQGSFWLRVELRARGGATLDPASLRVFYIRAWDVDVTSRVKDFLRDGALEVRDAQLPPGEHAFRVEVADTEGRTGSAVFLFRAR